MFNETNIEKNYVHLPAQIKKLMSINKIPTMIIMSSSENILLMQSMRVEGLLDLIPSWPKYSNMLLCRKLVSSSHLLLTSACSCHIGAIFF
jgi:hypothetical protein